VDNIDPSTIADLILENSNNLTTCAVNSICDYLDNGGVASISGNATGCNSVAEVQSACSPVAAIEIGGDTGEIEVSPNPTTGLVEIAGGKTGQTIAILRVTDVNGRLVPYDVFAENSSINLANQPDGMYFITLKTGSQILLKRVMKN